MEWTDPSTGLTSNTGTLPHDARAVEDRLTRAAEAWERWRLDSVQTRATVLEAVAAGLESQREQLAACMAREMGKPIAQGVLEVDKCAWVCRFYATEAEAMLAPTPLEHPEFEASLRYDPLGCVLGVMPWNFPLWQVFRFAAPTLMAGNAVLVKHAPGVPGCAAAIEELFVGAGAREGVLTNLFITEAATHELLADPRIAAVSLTGSTRAGRAVASTAGAHLKKCVLELGGSDPTVVRPGVDLEEAAQIIVRSRLANAGQSCIAAKRVVVDAEIHDELVARLDRALEEWTLGDPRDPATTIGPMARVDLRDEVARQVAASIDGGAVCVRGGQVPARAGAWYPPTLLKGVRPGMAAFDEEVFGPVVSVTRAEGWSEALSLANATGYGLGACLLGGDEAERAAFVEEARAGACFLGDFVRSDPRLPFGGIRESGYGRELGRAGILEFVNHKTVCVRRR